jgi:hypothetical protein
MWIFIRELRCTVIPQMEWQRITQEILHKQVTDSVLWWADGEEVARCQGRRSTLQLCLDGEEVARCQGRRSILQLCLSRCCHPPSSVKFGTDRLNSHTLRPLYLQGNGSRQPSYSTAGGCNGDERKPLSRNRTLSVRPIASHFTETVIRADII